MMIFWDERLYLMAVPKTGTHALEAALSSRADIVLRHPPKIKHMNQTWSRTFLRQLTGEKEASEFKSIAVMRDPVDWLGSWYRYRKRDDISHQRVSTRGVTFDQFLNDYMAEDRPRHAQLGRQWNMLRDHDDKVGVDLLFPYENFSDLIGFLEDCLDFKIELGRENVSPREDLFAEEATLTALKKHLAKDFALHEALLAGRDPKEL
ncbi:gamma-glutamyl kinase [Alphaproteobacteria bacterium KMM 3653]|uniref:Gamma-glutamyl kinase n=1 Tax=Harenicola maris TaxID=2841044 RepID=A0AAP2G6X8_9RHOB|nr:gamma-glutamyl kinase [Harenicola maris]